MMVCLPMVKVSPPFLSFFVLMLDGGRDSGDVGDIFRLTVIQAEFLDCLLSFGISRYSDTYLVALTQVLQVMFLYSSILVVLLP
jgi:hypothetical protein